MIVLYGVVMLNGDWEVYKFDSPLTAAKWLGLQTTPASYIVRKETAEEIAGRSAVKIAFEI